MNFRSSMGTTWCSRLLIKTQVHLEWKVIQYITNKCMRTRWTSTSSNKVIRKKATHKPFALGITRWLQVPLEEELSEVVKTRHISSNSNFLMVAILNHHLCFRFPLAIYSAIILGWVLLEARTSQTRSPIAQTRVSCSSISKLMSRNQLWKRVSMAQQRRSIIMRVVQVRSRRRRNRSWRLWNRPNSESHRLKSVSNPPMQFRLSLLLTQSVKEASLVWIASLLQISWGFRRVDRRLVLFMAAKVEDIKFSHQKLRLQQGQGPLGQWVASIVRCWRQARRWLICRWARRISS